MCQEHELGTINEYDVLSQQYKKDLAALKAEIDDITAKIKSQNELVGKRRLAYNQQNEQYKLHYDEQNELTEKDKQLIEKINQEVAKIDQQLDKIEEQIKANKNRQAELSALIAHNSAMMDGVVI